MYSERLYEQTPTRFWVNNPTPLEAKKALELGNTVSVASNGNYVKRMLSMDETKKDTISEIDRLIREGVEDDDAIVGMAAQYNLKKIAEIYRPIFEESEGELGWIAIQGNPHKDTDYTYMMAEAKRFYSTAPNMRVKFPATVEALTALRDMTYEGKATLATCGFSIPYARAAAKAYDDAVKASGKKTPKLFITTLAGPFDEYIEKYVKANNIDISDEVLSKAGCEMAKQLYMVQKRDFPEVNCSLLGGCRVPYHYTEMVPAEMNVTVNFDFIEKLNALDPPIEERITVRADEAAVKELCAKIPAFRYAFEEKGDYLHWSMQPSAQYFRNYVGNGWNVALGTVRERRILLK